MKISILVLTVLLWPQFALAENTGAYLGASTTHLPQWFKHSFLDFEEDVAEAAANNKRVMLYFHQDGCPYCARLVDENLSDPQIRDFVQANFDVVDINMWGDREVVSVAGRNFREKTFAAALKVQYTPTLIFLDENGKTALRLNGYYPPRQFRLALQYVAERKDSSMRFNEYVVEQSGGKGRGLIAEDFFMAETDLSANRKNSKPYLAVYFEAADCDLCELLHDKVLQDKPTRELVRKMDNVQIDILSDRQITLPSGETMSHRDYARHLNIGYTPSVVFYDSQGKEVHRIEGFLKTFHFQSSLAYVLENGYQHEPSFQRYIAARGEKLREKGFDTDIWGYESFHPVEAQ
jgi:thioredoxin-related protein